MTKNGSEYLKEYYLSNGKRIIVTTLRGKQHEICLSDDNKYFYSYTGLVLKAKGRPPKDYEITEDMKINELKYIIARKDSKIKRLEMENELMRDFLSLTERK